MNQVTGASTVMYPISAQDISNYLGTLYLPSNPSPRSRHLLSSLTSLFHHVHTCTLHATEGTLFIPCSVVKQEMQKHGEMVPKKDLCRVFARIVYMHTLREKLHKNLFEASDLITLVKMNKMIRLIARKCEQFPSAIKQTIFHRYYVIPTPEASAEESQFCQEYAKRFTTAQTSLEKVRALRPKTETQPKVDFQAIGTQLADLGWDLISHGYRPNLRKPPEYSERPLKPEQLIRIFGYLRVNGNNVDKSPKHVYTSFKEYVSHLDSTSLLVLLGMANKVAQPNARPGYVRVLQTIVATRALAQQVLLTQTQHN